MFQISIVLLSVAIILLCGCIESGSKMVKILYNEIHSEKLFQQAFQKYNFFGQRGPNSGGGTAKNRELLLCKLGSGEF